MLQFILTESHRWTPGELAQMAVEGGCLWISLHFPELSDAEIREIVEPDIVEMCREASVFLTVDDRPELARDLGLHGVRLSRRYFLDNPGSTPMGLREELGPEAVIGIECTDPTALPSFVPADIDFVTLPPDTTSEEREAFVRTVKDGGFAFPVVAEGRFDIEQALRAIIDGCAGVAIGSPISESHDPVTAFRDYLESIHNQ